MSDARWALVATGLLAVAGGVVRQGTVLKPANATLAAEFSVIASVRELADGRVLVTDEKENRIVVADLRSGAVNVLGRKGKGPGEYGQVTRLWALGRDSTVMSDMFARRLLLFDGAKIVSTIAPDAPVVKALGVGRVEGADAGGRITASTIALDRSGRGSMMDSMLVVRYDRTSGKLDTIAHVPSEFASGGSAPAGKAGGAPSAKPHYYLSVGGRDQIAVFPDGWVAIARVSPYRVDWCAPGAKCKPGPVLSAKPLPFTDREKRAYLELQAKTSKWPPTTAIDETAGWPEFIPPFVQPRQRLDAGALFPAPDGRLLIEQLPTADAKALRYDVVDRQGAVTGQLSMPVTERIVGFGVRSVFVAVMDVDGIQRLRRHPWP
jgi:hypothetical protein